MLSGEICMRQDEFSRYTLSIAHRWEIAPKTTLGEIVPALVIGQVVQVMEAKSREVEH